MIYIFSFLLNLPILCWVNIYARLQYSCGGRTIDSGSLFYPAVKAYMKDESSSATGPKPSSEDVNLNRNTTLAQSLEDKF